MIEFTHTIRDRQGLHARPVTQVALVVRSHESAVKINCGDRAAAGDDLMALLNLDASMGDVLSVRVEGPDEQAVAAELEDTLP